MAYKQQTSTKPTMENNNVAGGRLGFFEKGTGFFRDGYCRTNAEDSGNHSVAATVTKKFLDYTNSQGNNLGSLTPGQKWCLCASRWHEAMKAAEAGKLAKEDVPQVHLHATHDKALDVVSYKELKQYAAQGEATSQQGRQEAHYNPETPKGGGGGGGGGVARESKDIGNAQPSIAPGQGSHWNGGSMTESSGPRG